MLEEVIGAAMIVVGVVVIGHANRRRGRWRLLPGELRPWWEALPLAWARPRLEPFDHETDREQLGTMGEMIAGIVAVLFGLVVIWANTGT